MHSLFLSFLSLDACLSLSLIVSKQLCRAYECYLFFNYAFSHVPVGTRSFQESIGFVTIWLETDVYDYSVTSRCRSIEGKLYTKVGELQEEISVKRFDLGVAQLRLAAVQAQVNAFLVLS